MLIYKQDKTKAFAENVYWGQQEMGMLLEKGLHQVKRFYIEQLIKTGIYQPEDKELISMTISELKNIYQKEALAKA